MEKAILILDKMPKSCEDCELCRDFYLCLRLGEINESARENRIRDLRCPLKLIPKKLVVKEINTVEDFMHSDIMSAINKITAKISLETDLLIASGYNACIDEILGENNESNS